MVDIRIEPLSADQAELLLPLLDQVQALHVAAMPSIFHADATPEEKAAFLRHWLDAENIFARVARLSDGALIGYAIYELQHRQQSVLTRSNVSGFLHHIAIDAAYRGKGVGGQLLAQVQEDLRAQGAKDIYTEYFCFNAASAALMRSTGLEPLRVTARAKL